MDSRHDTAASFMNRPGLKDCRDDGRRKSIHLTRVSYDFYEARAEGLAREQSAAKAFAPGSRSMACPKKAAFIESFSGHTRQKAWLKRGRGRIQGLDKTRRIELLKKRNGRW